MAKTHIVLLLAVGAFGAAGAWYAVQQDILGPEPEAPVVAAAVAPPDPEPAAEPPKPVAPSGALELVRISPDGSGLIAGKVDAPGVVSVMLDGVEIAQAEPAATGEFVAFVEIAPSESPRRVQLSQGGELFGDSVIVAAAVAPVVPEPEVPVDAEPEVVAEVVPEVRADPPAVESVEDDAALEAPAVLIADEEGVRVVQDGPARPEVDAVALDSISYGPTGVVSLSGRGRKEAQVQVYLNNAPLADVDVGADGQWRLPLPDVAEGVYTLRVDELDAGGAVTSRIETPFKREDPADVAAVLAEETSEEGFDIAVRTVQPGNTLWAIAQEAYGDGVLYVRVFEANSALIRDPNLIYPGQIFRLPEAETLQPN